MIWSVLASGNFRGGLVVSISKARTIGSGLSIKSGLGVIMGESVPAPFDFTVYHEPQNIFKSIETLT